MDKLYLSIAEAAQYVGVGERYMRELCNGGDPPPHMLVGNKRLLQKAALEEYFEVRQEVRL